MGGAIARTFPAFAEDAKGRATPSFVAHKYARSTSGWTFTRRLLECVPFVEVQNIDLAPPKSHEVNCHTASGASEIDFTCLRVSRVEPVVVELEDREVAAGWAASEVDLDRRFGFVFHGSLLLHEHSRIMLAHPEPAYSRRVST